MASVPVQNKVSAENAATIRDQKKDSTTLNSSDSESDIRDQAEDIDGDYGSYRDHIFTDPENVKYWTNVMHNAQYEGRHRFDPHMTWSATEEKKLKRRVWHEYCFDRRD